MTELRLRRIDSAIMSNDRLTAALAWARSGVSVLAVWGVSEGRCDCNNPSCASPGKHPIGSEFPKGHKSATTDSIKIRRAFRRHPNANLAIVPPPGMVVVDMDGLRGKRTLERLKLPATLTVRTGRGKHFYYLFQGNPESLPSKLPGVDIKTSTGYVVAPPSIHASGAEYKFIGERRLAELSAESISPKSDIVRLDFSGIAKPASKGNRNNTLTRVAGFLRYLGLSSRDLKKALTALNSELCDPPLSPAEVVRIARSISNYESPHDEAFGTLADIVEKAVKWLLKPYLVSGAVNVIDGIPGAGKSTLAMALTAAITANKTLPFASKNEAGGVVILSAEDDPARVLKGRLRVNGADLTRVRFQNTPFTLDQKGLDLLRAEIEKHRPVLVIIDPLMAYLDTETDMNNAGEMTRFMTELDKLAREFETCVLVIRHLRKSDATEMVHRGLGSVAIAARVRSLMVLGRDPENPDTRALAQVKCSYAKEGHTIRFDVIEGEGGQPIVKWGEMAPHLHAEDIVARPASERGRPDDQRDDAKRQLSVLLADGPMLKSKIDKLCEAYAFSPATLRRAADELGIVKSKDGQASVWALPKRKASKRKGI